MPGRLRIGCSSWTSEAWWGKVYPADLPAGERLAAYARWFDTVEVDSSYYRDPGAYLVRRWARTTPEGFVFAMKVPRDLLDPRRPVDREAIATFEAHARELGPKLGPLLLQFPPWVKPGRTSGFLHELLASVAPDLPYAVELRDAGWFHGPTKEALLRRLEELRFALAWSYLTYVDIPPELTSDFVYLRFIGDHTTVPETSHGELRLDRGPETRLWSSRVLAVRDQVSNVFAFFNNHFAGFAPASVNLFRAELGLEPVPFGPGTEGGRHAPPRRQSRLDGLP